jgi:hypothetical protein
LAGIITNPVENGWPPVVSRFSIAYGTSDYRCRSINKSISGGLILQWNRDSDSGFCAGHASCMTLSGQVLHQHHLAATEAARRPVAYTQFSFSG